MFFPYRITTFRCIGNLKLFNELQLAIIEIELREWGIADSCHPYIYTVTQKDTSLFQNFY